MQLTLRNIFNFLKNYNSKNPELLILWLSQFTYRDQVIFMKLFIPNKFKVCEYKMIYNHINCKCIEIYDMIFKYTNIYKNSNGSIDFLGKCINEEIIDKRKNTPLEFEFCFSSKMNMEMEEIRFIKEYKFYNRLFDNTNYNNFNNYYNECVSIIDNFDKKTDSLPIRCFEYFKLDDLLEFIDVYELYILLDSNSYIKLYDFNMLLPEYMRALKLRNKEYSFNLLQESVLWNIYNFYNGSLILQADTQMKMTSGCPKLYFVNEMQESVDYIYQPRISGIRLVICKPLNSKVILTNKYNAKIQIPININNILSVDKSNSYTGEFIMVLYDKHMKTYLNRTELIKYMMSGKSGRINCEIRLFLLDLYIWNGVNLRIQPYGKRMELFDPFISMTAHSKRIMKLPQYDSISQIYDVYQQYLRSTDMNTDDIYIDGVVYRDKTLLYEQSIKCTKFKDLLQKFMIIKEFEIDIRILSSGKKEVIKPNSGIFTILRDVNISDFCVNFLSYNVSDAGMSLALFDGCKFSKVVAIRLDLGIKHIKKLMKRSIKIDDTIWNYIVVKVSFLNKNLQNIEIRPDKSLFDCFITKSEFLKYFESL
ncbi:hypothetical protein PmNV_048 [Penaeus monodon nudivirus]|uniref:Uncharacterized protein n=2 Tax=Lefavirales TaxID=2840070 RepID=A0A076FIY7_9VIRU|nr:hypothetical protein PmNV_048 [Penaeus monodon nudivirus]ABX44697.1 hypothetical protein [Penaeus monodon nucleopolyhedrovirus]AII15836.1 hypothetical protein PmNV_048 [Penaeus monodon nudivirus]